MKEQYAISSSQNFLVSDLIIFIEGQYKARLLEGEWNVSFEHVLELFLRAVYRNASECMTTATRWNSKSANQIKPDDSSVFNGEVWQWRYM